MDTLVTAVSTTLDDNYNMLVDYKEEEDEGDNNDNGPVTTILTTAQILEIDSSFIGWRDEMYNLLNPQHFVRFAIQEVFYAFSTQKILR